MGVRTGKMQLDVPLVLYDIEKDVCKARMDFGLDPQRLS